MKRASKKAILLFAVISLTLTVNIALLGGFHFADTVDANGHMSDCPLKDVVTICPMTPLGHIGAWKAAFASIFTTSFGMLLLLALCAFAVATIPWCRRRLAHISTETQRVLRAYLLSQSVVISPIQIALARGILNPKLF